MMPENHRKTNECVVDSNSRYVKGPSVRRRNAVWAAIEALESRQLLTTTVLTNAATSISTTGATLNATINAQGSSALPAFQFSTSPSFTPTALAVAAVGFNNPNGVAVDSTGDFFVADTANNAIEKIAPNSPTTAIGSGFSVPRGVAVDAFGNVFVADAGNNAVKKIATDGTITTIGSGFNSPEGVAVDAFGDVFVADTGNSAVKEVLANGTVNTRGGSAFMSPFGVAVDAAGNVFVADIGFTVIKKIASDDSVSSVGSGFSFPKGVAVDATGDLFVADTVNNAVKEVPVQGPIVSLSSAFSNPGGIAVDPIGDVFVGDSSHDRVIKLSPSSIAATPSPVSGSSSTSVSAALTGRSANTLIYYRAVASGAGGLVAGSASSFFTSPPPIVSEGTTTAITATGATISATVNPQGLSAGVNFQFSTDPTFPPTLSSTIGSGLSAPAGVAVDAAGDVFVADTGNNLVKEFLVNGTTKTIGSSFNAPVGLALDAGGDLFVADSGDNAVTEVLPDGTLVAIGRGYSNPRGVAVDAGGDVFVADTGNHAIEEVLPSGMINIISSALNDPRGLAVDAAGDVFVAAAADDAVTEIKPDGTLKTLGTGFGAPNGIAVDALGDVFVVDLTTRVVSEILPNGTQRVLLSNLGGPIGVAANAAGQVFIADTGSNSVVKLSPPKVVASLSTVTGSAATTVTGTLTGLTTGTLVYYRAIAASAGGTVAGVVNSFVPSLPPPTVVTGAASAITSHGATVGAMINPQGSSTAASFQFSTDAAFTPTVSTNIGSGFNSPGGVAVDGVGDVFVVDSGNNAVDEIMPNGASKTIGSGFSLPDGIAVDAAGDVFVADFLNNAIKEVLPNGTINTITTGVPGPRGIAVDAAGDVFAASSSTAVVDEVFPNGAIRTVGSGFMGPLGVAVDAAGDVFVADPNATSVSEVMPNGTITSVGSGFNTVIDVAVDGAGDLFVADGGSHAADEILPGGTIKTLSSAFALPFGIAPDASGDVFVIDSTNNLVVKLSPPTMAATPSPLTGSTAQAVSAALTGLAGGTPFFFRAIATNATGTTLGTTNTFTTLALTPTTTSLSLSATSVSLGTAVTLGATVASNTATGTVTFFDGTTQLGSPIPLANGLALFNTSSLATGIHSITAQYNGDATFATSTSSPSTLTVSPTAVITAPDITSNTAAEVITVVYTSSVAINLNTIASGNISVTAPGGQALLASAIAAMPNADGTIVTARYTFAAPGAGGSWILGTYQVALAAGVVKDSGGLGTSAATSTFASALPPQDLSATLAAKGTTTVVAGTALKLAEKLTLTPGAAATSGLLASATVVVSPDESSVDSILTLGATRGTLNFKNNRARVVNLRLPRVIPTTVAAGTYHILIRLTDTHGLVETYESGQTLTVVAPRVDLTGTFVKTPASVHAGKRFPVTFTVTNSSAANVVASGVLPFTIETSPDGLLSDATALSTGSRHIRLGIGKSIRITVFETLTSSKFLVVNLDPGNTVFGNDVNPANNNFHTTSQIQVG